MMVAGGGGEGESLAEGEKTKEWMTLSLINEKDVLLCSDAHSSRAKGRLRRNKYDLKEADRDWPIGGAHVHFLDLIFDICPIACEH